jgi:adenosylmethionine-8-amino-7-oxononanoate aminotransferase
MAIAKGLGGGYQPVGAVLAATKVVDAFRKGSGAFQHGHTYIGHPVAAAAALAVQRVMKRDRLVEQVKARGRHLSKALCAALGAHPCVGDIRGRGLFMGVELVQDRATKRPFDPKLRVHARIKSECMARGLMVYPSGGTVDGQNGDHVLIAPPFIATEADLDTIVERLSGAIDAATNVVHTEEIAK